MAQGVVEEDEEGELALRGEGGFGFVEEEEAVAPEFAIEEREESFAMRSGVEALAAIAWNDWGSYPRVLDRVVLLVDLRGGIEEAFGSEKETGSGSLVEGEAQCSHEGVCGVVVFGGVILDVAVAAFWAEAVVSGDGFEEGGFSGAVLSGEEGYAGVDRYLGQRGDGRDGEGVSSQVFDSFAQEGYLFQHGIGSELPFSITSVW
jgi:hypothetical protein